MLVQTLKNVAGTQNGQTVVRTGAGNNTAVHIYRPNWAPATRKAKSRSSRRNKTHGSCGSNPPSIISNGHKTSGVSKTSCFATSLGRPRRKTLLFSATAATCDRHLKPGRAQTHLDWHLKRCARDGTKAPRSLPPRVNAHGAPLSAGHFWERRAGCGGGGGVEGGCLREKGRCGAEPGSPLGELGCPLQPLCGARWTHIPTEENQKAILLVLSITLI